MRTTSSAILLAFAMACSKTTPEPEKEQVTPQPVVTTTSKPTTSTTATAIGPDEIGWDAPSAWQSVPNPNAMRKATYRIPKVDGDAEDAELSVSAASGGVEPNVKRWAGQFGNAEPKTERRTVNGLAVTLVEIKGTFASSAGMMGGPATSKDKFMLLGAVVDSGDRQHFFKMTGPEKTVTSARKDFETMVSSFRPK